MTRGVFKDHTGERFGRLTAIRASGSNGGRFSWVCKCDCGAETIVLAGSLRSGNTRSCGCLFRSAEGLSMKAEYQAIRNAMYRCTRPNTKQYEDYGGRGIKYLLPLDLIEAYKVVVDSIGHREDGMTLDRIDNDGHYEVGNLRWASRSEQRRNQRSREVTS